MKEKTETEDTHTGVQCWWQTWRDWPIFMVSVITLTMKAEEKRRGNRCQRKRVREKTTGEKRVDERAVNIFFSSLSLSFTCICSCFISFLSSPPVSRESLLFYSPFFASPVLLTWDKRGEVALSLWASCYWLIFDASFASASLVLFCYFFFFLPLSLLFSSPLLDFSLRTTLMCCLDLKILFPSFNIKWPLTGSHLLYSSVSFSLSFLFSLSLALFFLYL